MPTFIPPVVEDVGPAIKADRETWKLARHYRPTARGVNVFLLNDGTYTQAEPPNKVGVVKEYLGGHEHEITTAEAVALALAGYGAFIT